MRKPKIGDLRVTDTLSGEYIVEEFTYSDVFWTSTGNAEWIRLATFENKSDALLFKKAKEKKGENR